MELRRDDWAELWEVPLGGLQVSENESTESRRVGLQVSENESTESRRHKNGEVRGWYGFITAT